MARVRRGGRGTTLGGHTLTWTQAEGDRGTRWREALERNGNLVRALLLEVSPQGRPTRLEMVTPAGLLTLHPEPDESRVNGNAVGLDGVRHLSFAWSSEHDLLILDSPASAGIVLRRLAAVVPVGASRTLDLLHVDDDLDPRPVQWVFDRVERHAWVARGTEGTTERRLTVDDDGRPVLAGAVTWPLEA
jgi:hypothetical protein